MARKPRIHFPGGIYHVMLRGNGGQDIFEIDADRYHLFLLIQEGIIRYGHRIHAYCLMNNHIHLAIQVGEEPLSKIMQNLAFRYTNWINRKKKRTGHLFQGRYKAILVEEESYLVELIRYIHLNPVRAGWVNDPKDYRWSSHLDYLGEERNPWLTRDSLLIRFGKTDKEARRRYQKFVCGGIKEGHRDDFHRGVGEGKGRILGDDKFIETVVCKEGKKKKTFLLGKIIKSVCQEYQLDQQSLIYKGRGRERTEVRAVIAWIAVNEGSATLTDIAKLFQRDLSTISLTLQRVKARAIESGVLKRRIEKLQSELNIKL